MYSCIFQVIETAVMNRCRFKMFPQLYGTLLQNVDSKYLGPPLKHREPHLSFHPSLDSYFVFDPVLLAFSLAPDTPSYFCAVSLNVTLTIL